MSTCTKLFTAVPIICFSLFWGGCASIVKGTTQPIPVASDPSGADVKIDGNKVGQTPMSLDVKRKNDHLVTIEKAGYQPESIAITRNIGGAVYGNILAGGLVGWGVDAISGAQYNLSPKIISVTMKPAPTAADVRAVTEKSSAAVFIEELNKLDAMHVAKTITDEEYAKMRTALVAKYSTN